MIVMIPNVQYSSWVTASRSIQRLFVAVGTTFAIVLALSGCQNATLDEVSKATLATTAESSDSTALPRFDGVTVRVLVDDGVIDETLERHAQDFTAQTGAQVEIIRSPYEELYEKGANDFASDNSQYDAMIVPLAWLADYAQLGYLEDLSEQVVADMALEWDDIAPFFRDFAATYQDRVYSIPLDGDYHMVYYRIDVLEQAGLEPPDTWDDYLTVAEALNGQDFTGDGQPDYGSCIAKKPGRASNFFNSIVVSYLQSQGTAQGAFLDPATMDPLVNNAAFARALDVFKQTSQFGAPDEMTFDVDSHIKDMNQLQHCAQTIFWGDIPLLAIASESQLKENIGTVLLPGSTEVLDRSTGELKACDKFLCPYAIGDVNHAPFAANIGYGGSINVKATPEAKAASYALISYISQPAQSDIDVTIGATGFNPYRRSHFINREPWLAAGMNSEVAGRYLGVIDASLNSPNMVLDLIIPQANRYQAALDEVLIAFLRDQVTREEAIAQIEQKWNAITDDVGRDQQIAAYRRNLGL